MSTSAFGIEHGGELSKSAAQQAVRGRAMARAEFKHLHTGDASRAGRYAHARNEVRRMGSWDQSPATTEYIGRQKRVAASAAGGRGR